MIARFQNRQRLCNTVFSMSLAAFTGASSHVLAQEQVRQNQSPNSVQNNQSTPEQAARGRQTTKAPNERADDEAPALGVLTGSCPGNAVCVKGTLPYSPASEAGIEVGDYILSVDGKEVTSPAALKKLIENMKPDAEVTLKIWRQGEEMERKVQLASKSDQLPKGHDAWLGVMLSSDEKGGVKIDHIVPGSPASESELKEGDTLVKVRNEDIKDAQSFVEMIEEMGPGDELHLTIRRDNEERAIAVQLGNFGDAPMAFLRQLQPDFENPFPSGLQGAPASLQLIDRALDDMRRQIRALRDEIRELKGNERAKPAKPGDAKQGDVSALHNVGGAKLVSQIQLQIPQRNYRRNDFNRRYNPYGNYYNYNPYGRGYSPYSNNFGAPYGGNSYYYRYGGRPYYYGGNSNWYGNRPRAGIQIGPNIGVYWY